MVGHYDQVVSLGRGCQPAHQIRRICQGAQSHIFDWIITTDDGLEHLITAELEGFFERERLEMGPEHCVIDRVTDTRFLHEFPLGSDFDANYERNAERFAMLAERWRNLLASQQSVLFVRQHGWDSDARASAVRLRDAIAAKAPCLTFTLLYLTAAEAGDWGEAKLINRHLNQPEPYIWTGDDAAWEKVLGEALAHAPARMPQ